jgi:tetratricopeptide (TPR) repeat protein
VEDSYLTRLNHEKKKSIINVSDKLPGQKQNPTVNEIEVEFNRPIAKRQRFTEFIIGLVAIYLTLMYVQRYLTWDFLKPFYQTAVTIGFPGVLIAFFSLIFIFFDKSEIQKRFRSWIREMIEATPFPHWFLAVTLILCVTSGFFADYLVPIKWKSFINDTFLNGENNEYNQAKKTIENISKINESGSEMMKSVQWVFLERFAVNHQHKRIDEAAMRNNLNLLENCNIHNSFLNSFRQFGLAEGYSLAGSEKLLPVAQALDTAYRYYETFLTLSSNAITRRWKESALLNLGNTYWYENKFKLAEEAWRKLPKHPSTLGNIAAAQIMLGEFDKAIATADEGLALIIEVPGIKENWRASCVENKMIAQLSKGEEKFATETYRKHYFDANRIPDGSLETTYAIALILLQEWDVFTSFISSSTQISTGDNNMLWGLFYLNQGLNKKAAFKLLAFLDLPPNTITMIQILNRTEQILINRGYSSVTKLMALFHPQI